MKKSRSEIAKEVWQRPEHRQNVAKGYLQGQIPNVLIGIAGVHWVVSELSLRGLVAMPTIRNVKGIDVIVSDVDGKMATLQVKTSLKTTKYWLMPSPEKCLKGEKCFYVFVRWAKEGRFEAFLESAEKVREQIQANLELKKRKSMRGLPYFGFVDAMHQEELRLEWLSWKP
jgi:hypothetical protein